MGEKNIYVIFTLKSMKLEGAPNQIFAIDSYQLLGSLSTAAP